MLASIIAGCPIKTELFIPLHENHEEEAPEVSIVVPALNEQITIGEFIDWCWEGLAYAGIKGEIIIIDSSSDHTPNIALSKGARVLRTPKRGLGQAYQDAIPFIRGRFIIMGDCDLTYDFREINLFVDRYYEGYDFIMGSRFKGSIEKGSMPFLHRYFGTPITTWILNRIYRSKYSDIHCGMRGLTKEALLKINLTSKDWEYASEMVLKASRLQLNVSEVPVKFYKDREGRVSHHRRAGFWSPWLAGWINLKVMLVYSPDSFLVKPGLIFFILGFILSLAASTGSFFIGSFGFNMYSSLLGMALTILGAALFQVGILARNTHGLRNGIEQWFNKNLTYNRGMSVAFFLIILGVIVDTCFVIQYISDGFIFVNTYNYSAIFGLMAIILGVQVFSFTLLLELDRQLGRTNICLY